jgi:hypothetical protein
MGFDMVLLICTILTTLQSLLLILSYNKYAPERKQSQRYGGVIKYVCDPDIIHMFAKARNNQE